MAGVARAEEAFEIVATVQRLLREGRVTLEGLRQRLTAEDLAFLREKPCPDLDVPADTRQRLETLVDIYCGEGAARAVDWSDVEEEPPVLLRHGTRDSMTGLPNRAYFEDQLERSLALANRRGSQVAVFFLDLDRFKYINDTLGHDVGDSLIMTMADRLAGIARKSDLVARVGGDEFLLMVQGRALEEAASIVAEKILIALRRPFRVDGREFSFTGSLGVALCPGDATTARELVRKAEEAMVQAKARGRNGHHFYNRSLREAADRKLAVEGRLRRALDREELSVQYQPRIDVSLGRVVGAEALVRWCDPELGELHPDEFIPIAEECGLIGRIGEWVLETACIQQQAWQAMGFRDFRISVNVSARQLQDDSLLDAIVGTLQRTGFDPRLLDIELTEGALIEHQDFAAALLLELAQAGVRISLDDFGTGFSSLAYLRRFPVHTIKIDQSFVRDMFSDPDDAAIVEAIISIARTLRLHVIAEGVEIAPQCDLLRSQGCNEMQGFLFSPPLDAFAFTEKLAARAFPTG